MISKSHEVTEKMKTRMIEIDERIKKLAETENDFTKTAEYHLLVREYGVCERLANR